MPESDNAWSLAALQASADSAAEAKRVTESIQTDGIDPGVALYNPEWDKGRSLEALTELERSSRSEQFRRWLREANNPELVAQSIDAMQQARQSLDRLREPEPVSIWSPVATEVKSSLGHAYTGLLSVPAAVASIPHAVGMLDGDSPFTKLTEVARAHYDARADERSEQAYRNEQAGGGRVKMIVGSLLGQGPEMVATGFGTTSAVKSLFQAGTKAALTAGQIKAAFVTSSAVQAGMEAAKNTVGRMADNVAAGEDALSASDVAAAMAITAVTMLTEIPFGMRGEFRALGQRQFVNRIGDAAGEFAMQAGQEATQEGMTQIINDLADGSYINWSEVGWSALAGAIGGGFFAGPSVLGSIVSGSANPAAAAEVVRVATAMAKAPAAVKFSGSLTSIVEGAAAAPDIRKQDEPTLRQMFANENNGDVHLTLDDFTVLAEKRGSTVQSLLIEMGANASGGDVAIPTENFIANMVKNSPELMKDATDMVKASADAPSRKELGDIVDAMEALKQRKLEDTLPDGVTKDDSQEIVDEMTAEVVTAAAVAGAKLTDAQARTAAELTAVQARAAAIAWNTAYAAQGKTDRVTPKQLWSKYRAAITGEAGGDAAAMKQADQDRGQYDWNKAIVRIGKAADASTVHHELMHHWLEVTKAWAANPAAPDIYRQNLTEMGDWAAKNADKVASVYKKVSGKDTSREAIIAAAGDIANLNLNSQAGRAIHEAIAYGYEQYLTTGKAPTKELKRIFKQIANYFAKIIKQLMRSETLTDPALTKVFDRMLTAADATAVTQLTPAAIEASGMSPEMAALVFDLYGDQIASAQQEAYAKITKRVTDSYNATLAKQTAEERERLMTQPVYKAQEALSGGKMNAAKVAGYLNGTEYAKIDLTGYVAENGSIDPDKLATDVGATGGVVDLLVQLAAAESVDAAAKSAAEAKIDELYGGMSPAEMAQEIVDSDSGSLMIAAAELRALRAPAAVAGQAQAEARTDVAEQVQKAEEKAKTDVAATRDQMQEAKAAMRQKARDLADRARTHKIGLAADGRRLQQEMRQDMDAQINAGAAYRMETEPLTANALSSAIEAESRRLAKYANKGDIEAALMSYVEIETLTEMQRLAAAMAKGEMQSKVAEVKATARDQMQEAKEDRLAAKRTAMAALRTGAQADVRILRAWAHEQVRRMPMSDLKPAVWARRVEAARRRREVAAAKQDAEKILQHTEEIAYALAMQQEILRTQEARQAMADDLLAFTKAKELQRLADSGYPTVVVNGQATAYLTMEAAEAAQYIAPHGATIGRTSELGDIARGIAGLLSSNKQTQAQAVQSLMTLKSSVPGLIIPEVQRMLENGKLVVYYGPARNDLIRDFTTDDFAALTAQVVFLRQEAARRPSVASEQAKMMADGIQSVQSTYDAAYQAALAKQPSTLPKEKREANAKAEAEKIKRPKATAWDLLYRTQQNITVHLHALGDFGKRIIAKLDDATIQQQEYRRQISRVLESAQKALHKDGVDRNARKEVMGVQTSRHEDLVRLLMIGTQTGRQRVAADLELAKEAINVNQYLATISTVTPSEAAWLSAMWQANEMIWQWDSAAAQNNGVPLPKKLEATTVPVVVDGKQVDLSGGYASVPYIGGSGPAFDMLTDAKVRPADVARGLFKDREDIVIGKRLDLTSEAQVRGQMSHIRTAAFLGVATEMRVLLAPDSEFRILATERLGEGFIADMESDMRFTVTGLRPQTGLERGLNALHFAQQIAVFGLNVTSAVSQITGLVSSIGHPNIGPKAVIGATGRILYEMGTKGIKSPFSRVGSESVEMLHRSDGQQVDWYTIDEISGRETPMGKWRTFTTAPIRRMQQVVDVITYQAAHDRAMAELPATLTMDERLAQAKRIATNAVKDTQGTALRSRAADINKSQLGICMTFAAKWQINNANWLATLYMDAKRKGWKGGKRDFLVATLTSVLGSTAAMIAIRAALQPEDDDEKQRDLQDYAIKMGIDATTQPYYLGKIVANVAQQAFTDQVWSRPSELVTTLKAPVDGASMIIKQMKDSTNNDDVPKIIGGLIGIGSIVPGVPSVQLKRAVDAFSEKDKWEDPWETYVQAIFGPDRVTMIK